jgi:hypothetical protein
MLPDTHLQPPPNTVMPQIWSTQKVLFITLIVLNSGPHQMLYASYLSSSLCPSCKHVQQPKRYQYITCRKRWCFKLHVLDAKGQKAISHMVVAD